MAVILTKLVLNHQTNLLQEHQSPIDCSQADARFPFPGPGVNGLGIQMPLAFSEDFQHELPLAGKPASLAANRFDQIKPAFHRNILSTMNRSKLDFLSLNDNNYHYQ
jgi:hypothetical protein